MLNTLAFFTGGIGWMEVLVLGIVALLIFGKRLPEVGRSLGKGIVEFKKGLAGIEHEIDSAADQIDAAPKALDGDRSASVGHGAGERERVEPAPPRQDGA